MRPSIFTDILARGEINRYCKQGARCGQVQRYSSGDSGRAISGYRLDVRLRNSSQAIRGTCIHGATKRIGRRHVRRRAANAGSVMSSDPAEMETGPHGSPIPNHRSSTACSILAVALQQPYGWPVLRSSMAGFKATSEISMTKLLLLVWAAHRFPAGSGEYRRCTKGTGGDGPAGAICYSDRRGTLGGFVTTSRSVVAI